MVRYGDINYVGKFIPNLSEKAAPLRLLQNAETQWLWDKLQQDAFDLLKDCVASTQVLRYYSLEEPIVVTVDSSSYGLGACLLQDDKPVAFASRSLSKSEKNYGQIEKEMLAIAWGCEKFHDYIYGRSDNTVETDHEPLEALYKEPIDSAPPRIQRIMLRIQKYSFSIVWRKGKDLIIADTLSRAPQPFTEPNNVEEYKVHSVRNLPISDVRIAEFRRDEQGPNFTNGPKVRKPGLAR